MLTLAEVAYKTCTKCHESKSLDCFHKLSAAKDGLNSCCKECRVKDSAKYYLANTEKVKASVNQFHADNPEKRVARSKKYRIKNRKNLVVKSVKYQLNNPEIHAASAKKYRLANPEKYRDYANTRRARKLDNGVYEISTKELNKLYSSPCFYCGSTESIQMDHVMPIAKGGRHSIGNLVPACARCNNNKKDKFLIEWKHCRMG